MRLLKRWKCSRAHIHWLSVCGAPKRMSAMSRSGQKADISKGRGWPACAKTVSGLATPSFLNGRVSTERPGVSLSGPFVPASLGWNADIRDSQQFRLGRGVGTPNKVRHMWHDDAKAREAFRRGAREAFDSCVIRMDPRQKAAVTQWLDELEEWDEGEPPAAPSDW